MRWKRAIWRTAIGLTLSAAPLSAGADAPRSVAFEKRQLSQTFYSEGAHFGDFNHDGHPDIVSGPFWYEGPEFKKSHAYYEPKAFDGAKEWSNAFFAFTGDLNGDGWDDIIIIGFPGEDASWFENPKSGEGPWKRHLMLKPVDDESPTYAQLIAGLPRQLVCIHDQQFGYAVPDPNGSDKPWIFHPISPKSNRYYKYTHGLGIGDINGDGRADLIEKGGWWEQPADLTGDPVWKHHAFTFAAAGAQMHVYDVNGDGKADVITSLNAHGYGLAWYEQTTKDGEISFIKHVILTDKPDLKRADEIAFSQLHAVDLADINGDGLLDIITGKRHWAHGDEGDPDPNGPSLLYWFELKRGKNHTAEFIPHLIDDDSGVGTQVLAADINADGKPDIIIGNKNGTFVFTQTDHPVMRPATTTASAAAAPPPVDHFKEYVRSTEPLKPADEEKSFHLPPGFEIHLVAAETDITKPINLAFDAKGRLWLTSTREYPFPKPAGSDGKDSLRYIELDPTGKARHITTFADKLDLPIGLYPTLPNPIAYDIPTIKRYYDDNHDGRADRSEVLYGPFGYEIDTHGQSNAFRRGFDGWLYADHGYGNTSTITAKDGQTTTLKLGNTYRMRLDGSHLEIFTHGQTNPFGLTWDEMGNLYSSDSTSKPFFQLLRGGFYECLDPVDDGLGFAPRMMNHMHGSTAICAGCCYTADVFPPEFRGNLFCGNVVTCRINRDSVTWHGSTPTAHEQPDFLISDDPWFRPVDIQLGPDGALYVADFYNRIIGHYEVPLDHPGRDHLRGRIWRISYHATDAGVPDIDMTTRSIDGLIELLANPNLKVRMLATDELTDRIGKPAIEPLTAFIKTGNAIAWQRVHAMWALYRLAGLDDALLTDLAHDKDSLVRVHAMRVLADEPNWMPAHHALAIAGLADSFALARRCAVDALGAHPDAANVRPLLDLFNSADRADTHLVYVTRMAIRDSLKPPGAFANLGRLSPVDLKTIADLSISIPTPAAADFLLANLDSLTGTPAQLAAYTRHAVRYVASERVESLLAAFHKKLADQPAEQLAVLTSVARGAAERGQAVPPSCNAWALDIIHWALAPSQSAQNPHWTFSPLEGTTGQTNPWVIDQIPSADGDKSSPFFTSLPLGETLTGYLRSAPFPIPPKLTFYLAGQNGRRRTNPPPKNFARLRSADDKSILAEAPVPRNDIAQLITWDLHEFAGRQGYIELVDANDGVDYAWLAAGRFQPDVAPIPPAATHATGQERIAACELAGVLKLAQMRDLLIKSLDDKSAAAGERSAAAAALVSIDAGSAADAILPVIADPSAKAPLRISLVDSLPALHNPAQFDALIGCFSRAPWKLQTSIALALTKTPEGADAMMNAAAADKAPRPMLQNYDVRTQILLLHRQGDAERIAALTKGLPSITEELQRLARARVVAFQRSPGDPAKGEKIFAANCMVCHTINNQGGRVGPLLDGIGSRGIERLVEDILDPNRNVDPAFRYSNVSLKDGRDITGILRRTDGDTVVYTTALGKDVAIPKSQIVSSIPSTLSLMPSGFGDVIKPNDFNDLLAFLLQPQIK